MSNIKRGTTHVVTGISSVGKSTFIHSVLLPELANKSPQVLFPAQRITRAILRNHTSDQESVIHYPISRMYRFLKGESTNPFLNDWFIKLLLRLDTNLHFYVLVASRAILDSRTRDRTHLEPLFHNQSPGYPTKQFYCQLQERDYIGVYGVFFSFIRQIAAGYQIIDTSQPDYRQLNAKDEVFALLRTG